MPKYSYGATAWGRTPITYLVSAILSWLIAPFYIVAGLFGTPDT